MEFEQLHKDEHNGHWVIKFPHHRLVVHDPGKVLRIASDIIISLCYIAGSMLFFQNSTQTAGVWLFVMGSCQMLVRSILRILGKMDWKER
ncbi:YrhK family protein [Paenibacillus sp. XY044]|uniref:YrhK family protein n=1 Tax=Paenibacillus sp. XY044 TaxID=2026089 RepID=UPI0015C6471D|nr:YrhK family protein [Paenibacillus sp. XY044]